jgi:hypothetical protein
MLQSIRGLTSFSQHSWLNTLIYFIAMRELTRVSTPKLFMRIAGGQWFLSQLMMFYHFIEIIVLHLVTRRICTTKIPLCLKKKKIIAGGSLS